MNTKLMNLTYKIGNEIYNRQNFVLSSQTKILKRA